MAAFRRLCHVTLTLRVSWITSPDLRRTTSADKSASTAYLICTLRSGHSAGQGLWSDVMIQITYPELAGKSMRLHCKSEQLSSGSKKKLQPASFF